MKPTISFDDGNGVTLDAALSGLGNGDVTIVVDFHFTAMAVVENPQGKASPGQQIDFTTTGSQSIPQEEFKNGNVHFS